MNETIAEEISGTIVLTTYNDRTYRIDDVEWDMSPSSKFQQGTEFVTFSDYYQKVSRLFRISLLNVIFKILSLSSIHNCAPF